jgi:hypothetical protein
MTPSAAGFFNHMDKLDTVQGFCLVELVLRESFVPELE